MPETSDERALATRLATLTDAALSEVLTRRGVSASAPWHDFFDAAAALLDPASIDRSLLRLPRLTLAALVADEPAPDSGILDAHLLVDGDGVPFAAVAARARAAAAAHPEAFGILPDPPLPSPTDEAASAAAAERLFTTVGALADVLLACLHAPFSRTGTGSVSATERRRLVDAGILDSAEELDDFIAAAEVAGLVRAGEREWVATSAAHRWLRESTPTRWQIVVEGFRDALPEALRTPDGGYLAVGAWPLAFPLDPDWPDRAARLVRIARRWALIAPNGDEPGWARPLREGGSPAVDELTRFLPAEIDRVYLQADLTAIAPGPLAPALDLRLRSIAHRESRAQASTYRFSAESLGSGMTDGENAESVRAFLSEISLTGIPQPLDYLIESTADRHGRVTVRTDAATGRTRIDSEDPSLRDTIAVDQALRPLGLVSDGFSLTSRVARDAVYWALADARYPVVALDHAGDTVSLRRGRLAPDDVPTTEKPYARLIATLRASEGSDEDVAWLERELEMAVRTRSVITVAVRLPDGSERSFTLEASGLGGGRLRGRDRGADIERTLPVSSIVSVRPVA
ncbi:hypothetical protein ASD65_06445 [Microbacterium sp. Root61]|uniref:helicase-associated domain-containing protein n=1 Tax=Microbacterium sp. Root61 TaxID=1736570 RepID=UPI0006F6F923|nr:helicase-associated domain-containing protein [Microbacterium sp. Root61]KRA24103.1 hypothetical protein ASD65_06445 [Microbacterium sp. Root61]